MKLLIAVAIVKALTISVALRADLEQDAVDSASFRVGRNGLPLLIPVYIGKHKREFLLDTGTFLHVFDKRFRDTLGAPVRTSVVSTPGGDVATEMFTSPPMRLGKWDLPGEELVAVADLSSFYQYFGRANFVATIVRDIEIDDGAQPRREFELSARLGSEERRFTVPVARFRSLDWASEHLGAKAIIYPGEGKRDHTRCAVQTLSEEVEAGARKRT